VLDAYKAIKFTTRAVAVEETARLLRALSHFDSTVANGEITVTSASGQAQREKGVLLSLGFCELRAFKPDAVTPLLSFPLAQVKDVEPEGRYGLLFEYSAGDETSLVSCHFNVSKMRDEFLQTISRRIGENWADTLRATRSSRDERHADAASFIR
jgi:hypothetical protein